MGSYVWGGLGLCLVAMACTRPQPCDGNKCGGHGTCSVLEIDQTLAHEGEFSRQRTTQRVETCDCDGAGGFVYRPVGCGPAKNFSTCLPEPCATYVQRCTGNTVCTSHGHRAAPACEACPAGMVARDDRLGCRYPACNSAPANCAEGRCGDDGECVPCPAGEVPDSERLACHACPSGFAPVGETCQPTQVSAFLITKLQMPEASPPEVVGKLNENALYRAVWDSGTDNGYNMIWDEDLLIVGVLPEFPNGDLPDEPAQTEIYLYESWFAASRIWQEARGEPEPKEFRDPTRPKRKDNYFAGELSGEACAAAVGLSCNPAHFSGLGVMQAREATSEACTPTIARLAVEVSRDAIRTTGNDWVLFPYNKYGFIFQAQNVELDLVRTDTGLCDGGGGGDPWPCQGYSGYFRTVVRGTELFAAIHRALGGGVGEDFAWELLGDMDADLDGDGANDAYSLQYNLDLAPVIYSPTPPATP